MFKIICGILSVQVAVALAVPINPQIPQNDAKRLAKRELCQEDGGDKYNSCPYWQSLGYCESNSIYHNFMIQNCEASCGVCQAPPTPPPVVQAVTVNTNDCLAAHNEKRALHEATSPLVYDATLAQHAQDWANHLADLGSLQHDQGSGEGENLYYFAITTDTVKTCRDAVDSWYAEVNDYPFNNPPNSIFDLSPIQIGHFTQIVWKDTTKVGVGIAKIRKDGFTRTYIVARYSPPGNFIGQTADKVGNLISN